MSKKLIFSILVVMMFALSMTLGTYAYFTSQTTISNNTFSTGSIAISALNEGDNAAVASTANLLPGESVSGNVTINNQGDTAFKYAVSAINVNGDAALFSKLNAKLTSGTTTVYDGPLNALNFATVNSSLSGGSSDVINFEITLPVDAGNEYQNKSLNVQLMFSATQTSNPGWGE